MKEDRLQKILEIVIARGLEPPLEHQVLYGSLFEFRFRIS